MAENKSRLREGYTTGTCAAAAAKAATACLLQGLRPASVSVSLPPFEPPLSSAHIPLERVERLTPEISAASVIKDGGDDPDVTHKARIVVFASSRPFAPLLSGSHHENTEADPLRALFFDCLANLSIPLYPCPELAGDAPEKGKPTIILYGGTGVGLVTLPGLPVQVGEPAINPVPRRQIALAAREAAGEAGYAEKQEAGHPGEVHLIICVPDGAAISTRTLNARLGIMGGISILGTGGIVRPYSHEAWTCTISQAISVAAALGLPEMLFTTGRRSERLGQALLPELAPQAAVQVADYAAFAIRAAAVYPFARIHWLCFPGKLLKLAQGLEWTHAKGGAADMQLLTALCRQAGATNEQCAAIAAMPTASGALDTLAATPLLHKQVLAALARKAFATLRGWLENAGNRSCTLQLHVFSLDERLLLSLSEKPDDSRQSPEAQ